MRRILALGSAFWLVISCFPCDQAQAATWIVSSAADNNGPNTFTLRDVVNNHAQAGDTISFGSSVGQTITLTLGELVINKDLSIKGPGATKLSVVGMNQRVFHVFQGMTLNVSGLRLGGTILGAKGANGPSGSDGNAAGGGAILTELTSSLKMTNCYLAGCRVEAGAGGDAVNNVNVAGKGGKGGPAFGGAIESHGNLILHGCTFAKNRAVGGAGGKGQFSGAGGDGGTAEGGAVYQGYTFGCPSVIIVNCTFSGNLARGGNGGKGGDAPFAVILALPLNGGPGGAGGTASGGGIFFYYGCPAGNACEGVVHCTICKNVCGPGLGGVGGSGINGGSPGATGANGAAKGCGLYDSLIVSDLQIANTIVAGNYTQPINLIPLGKDVYGPVISAGYNLIGELDANSTGWLPGIDYCGTPANPLKPGLGLLQNNGGETPTMAPLMGSKVIDAGTVNCAPLDQIGNPRPVVVAIPVKGSDGSDIGACEAQAAPMKAAAMLTINTFDTDLIVSWPASLEGFVLQESSDLAAPNWVDSRQTINAVGDDSMVVIQSPTGNRFFRLAERDR